MQYGKGVTDKAVSSRQLKLLMNFKNKGELIKFLRLKNYVKYEKKINIENLYHNVWYKNVSKIYVNKLFRASMA